MLLKQGFLTLIDSVEFRYKGDNGDRKGQDRCYAVPTKIHNELGWLPETKIEDGIKATVQWYLDNRSWWENIISGDYQDYYERMYVKNK